MVLSTKKCVMKDCRSLSHAKNFPFPDDIEKGLKWLSKVENDELQNTLYMDIVKEGYFVCYKHFVSAAFLMSPEEVYKSQVPCSNIVKEDKKSKRSLQEETEDESKENANLPKKRRRLLNHNSCKSESDGSPCKLSSADNSPVIAKTNSPKKAKTYLGLFTSPIRDDSGSPIVVADICHEVTKGTGAKHDFNNLLIILNETDPIKLYTKEELTPSNINRNRLQISYKNETPKRCYNLYHSSTAYQNYGKYEYKPKEQEHHKYFLSVRRKLNYDE